MIKFDAKNEPKYTLGDFNKPNTFKVYKNNIQKKCDNLFTDNMSSQDRWNNICETCKDAGAKILQKKKINHKHQDLPYLPYPTLQFSEEWARGRQLMACLTP